VADGGQRRKVKNGMLELELAREKRKRKRREERGFGAEVRWHDPLLNNARQGLGLPLL
jgi:hypothetical protein